MLFIPANTPSLRAVFSYYTSTVTVNPEGDVHVSDETVEGLGKKQFPRNLIGALFKILRPPPRVRRPLSPTPAPVAFESLDAEQDIARGDASHFRSHFPWDAHDEHLTEREALSEQYAAFRVNQSPRERVLTGLLPDPGYFVAGGIAGVVSRTATAPLDRLKVYLIAQVGVKNDAIHAAKSGAPVQAAKTAARPLVDATKTLWRMGGMRSLFAGTDASSVDLASQIDVYRERSQRFESHA